MNSVKQALVIVGLVCLVVVTRILPHPPNFAPVGALALFVAAVLPDRRLALALPVFAMLVSDVLLEAMIRLELTADWMKAGSGFYPGFWVVYGTYLLITLMGFALRNNRKLLPIAGMTLLAAI